mmetsp:Transcript_27330/g.55861  ORF Transcript_27330/g.55861 Transcript_27330/m.55861 type:complete len:243 (+) Transcript_27330:1504-2232(+)
MRFVESVVPAADVALHVRVGLARTLAEGRNTRQQNVQNHSQTPHVGFRPVPRPCENVGGCVAERPQLLVQPLLSTVSAAREELRETEVCNLDLSIRVVLVQDVLGLEITVHDAARVHVSYRLKHLSESSGGVPLRKGTPLCDATEHLPSHRQLHHHVEHFRSLEPIHKPNDAAMVHLCQSLNLGFILSRVAQSNDLDGKRLLILEANPTHNLATSTTRICSEPRPNIIVTLDPSRRASRRVI